MPANLPLRQYLLLLMGREEGEDDLLGCEWMLRETRRDKGKKNRPTAKQIQLFVMLLQCLETEAASCKSRIWQRKREGEKCLIEELKSIEK